MSGKILIQFTKTGKPWCFYGNKCPVKGRCVHVSFVPIIRWCVVTKVHNDGSVDVNVTINDFVLSNGNGPPLPRHYNLQPEGTVRYIDPWTSDIIEWGTNVPTWKRIYYEESRDATLTFLMVCKRLPILHRDMIQAIAKMIYNSYDDPQWQFASASAITRTTMKQ